MKELKTQNTKHKIPNTNNGITLIALVVTIIVMLILVAVTISMAINGGLFEKAQEAGIKTNEAVDAEQQLANGTVKIGNTVYNSIDEYLGITKTPTEEHNWTRGTGENIDVFTCSHCNANYTMGEVVNYVDAGAASAEVTSVRSGLDAYYTENEEYPEDANADENGKQTITAGENLTWVVLGIEDTDGNGTNETLLITTEEPVNGYYMYGAAAYNYAPSYYENGSKVEGDIDRICRELYSNSEYGEARGMTIDDVNAALNYTPLGGFYYDNGYKTTGDLTTRLDELPEAVWNNIKTYGTKTPNPNDTDSESDLGAYGVNGYYYSLNGDETALTNPVDSTTSSITAIEKAIIFGANKELIYVLASRGVSAVVSFAIFGPGVAGGGDAYSYSASFHSGYGANGGELVTVRPVVSLTSKLPTVK